MARILIVALTEVEFSRLSSSVKTISLCRLFLFPLFLFLYSISCLCISLWWELGIVRRYFYLFIYLFLNIFVYLVASGLSRSMRDLHLGMWDLSLQHMGLLSSCGMWAPEHAGSVVAVHGLSSCGMQAVEHTGLAALQHVGS